MKRNNGIKHYLIGALTGVAITALLAFSPENYQPGDATAEVARIDGAYIFTDSRPVTKYESLGTVDVSIVTDNQYESVRKHLLKRARKKYPELEAVIMKFNKGGVDRCEAIRFVKS